MSETDSNKLSIDFDLLPSELNILSGDFGRFIKETTENLFTHLLDGASKDLWCSFETKSDDPLDLLITFPAFYYDPYADDAIKFEMNLRDFIVPDMVRDDPKTYKDIPDALRKFADQLDDLMGKEL
jgi:hypothetical protein